MCGLYVRTHGSLDEGYNCVLKSHFAHHAHTLIMENTQRNACDAVFKLKAKIKVTLRVTMKERLRK